MLTIRVGGASGEGIDTTGITIAKILAESGAYVFGHRGYQSLVRGGYVWYQIAVDDKPLKSFGENIDILIPFNNDAVANSKDLVKEESVVVYDPSLVSKEELQKLNTKNLIEIEFLKLAGQKMPNIVKNSVAIGVVMKLLGVPKEKITPIVSKTFKDKPKEIIDENLNAIVNGYNSVQQKYKIKYGNKKIVLDGNTATALGAVSGGLDFFAAYPMTPASGILHFLSQNQEKLNVFVKQFEDEISVANSVIGAAFAGARAMCATSGGGLSLMTEAASFAGMIEAPVVFVNSQRTGPSTGLPTKTDQSDLRMILGMGQGDWPRIIIAPANAEECFFVGAQALNLAQKYQTPVFILLDQYLSERLESVDKLDVEKIAIQGPKMAQNPKNFKRYLVTKDGVSPIAFPGMEGFEFTASSYEHDEYGNTVSDIYAGLDYGIKNRVEQHEKRMRKLEAMKKDPEIEPPRLIGKENADVTFVCWGSTVGTVEEAIEELEKKGVKANAYAFKYLFPLKKEIKQMLKKSKVLVDVECNYTGQFAELLKANFGIKFKKIIKDYTGEPLKPSKVVEETLELIGKKKKGREGKAGESGGSGGGEPQEAGKNEKGNIVKKLKENLGFVE